MSTWTRKAVVPVLFVFLIFISAFYGKSKDPFSNIPTERREQLPERLNEYVKAYRSRNWPKLYDLVSSTAKGGVTRQTFVARMTAEHGEQFSSFPDLLEFHADHVNPSEKDEYDIYGCGKAQREGMEFNGIALVHAVFEHKGWYFSGWSFTEFPNEPCKLLDDPSWKPPAPMEWGQPMGELRSESR